MNILALSLFAGINFAFSVVGLLVFKSNRENKSHLHFTTFSFFSGLYFLLSAIGTHTQLDLGVWVILSAAVYYSAFPWFVLEFIGKKLPTLRWIFVATFFCAFILYIVDPTYQSFSIWQIVAHLGLLGLMGLTTYGSITLWYSKKAAAPEFSILSFAFITLGMLEILSTYSYINIYPESFNHYLPLDLFPFLFTIVFARRLARDLIDLYKFKVKSMESIILENQLKIERIEKARLQEQLQFTNNDLSDFGLEITRMKSFAESIYTKLIALKTDTNQKEIDQLISFTKSNLQIDKELAQFQNKVETINHEFLSKLKLICPELSKNELQLASLLRLKLNTKEIAAVKNISPDSVKVLRHRLRKKLDLPVKTNLSTYISNI